MSLIVKRKEFPSIVKKHHFLNYLRPFRQLIRIDRFELYDEFYRNYFNNSLNERVEIKTYLVKDLNITQWQLREKFTFFALFLNKVKDDYQLVVIHSLNGCINLDINGWRLSRTVEPLTFKLIENKIETLNCLYLKFDSFYIPSSSFYSTYCIPHRDKSNNYKYYKSREDIIKDSNAKFEELCLIKFVNQNIDVKPFFKHWFWKTYRPESKVVKLLSSKYKVDCS